MEFLQELFVTALLAIVLSFLVAISIAMAGSEEKNDHNKKEQKMVPDEVKLDKRLKVKGGKIKKRVKFADDVVVKNVDHFEVAAETTKNFEFSEKLSRKVGLFDELSQGVIVGAESEEAKVIRVDDQFGGDRVVKESEPMSCGEELVKECDRVNMSKEVKGDDDEKKDCKDAGLLDKGLERKVLEQKSEATKRDEFHDVEGKTKVVGGLEALDFEEKVISEEIGGDPALELVKDDARIDREGCDEAGDHETNSSELLDEALKRQTIENNSRSPEINLGKSFVGGGLEDVVVDKKLKGEGLDGENDVQMAHDDTDFCQNEEGEVVGVGASGDVVETKEERLGKGNEVEEGLVRDKNIDDDDDWEGVESSELEKVFAEAVNYVECRGKGRDEQLANLGSDVRMQLYGLQRLALEGPCHESQPMALKVSARAKWNAWQRLGTMSPEVAMEQYIKLLSDTEPCWTEHSSADDGKNDFVGSQLTGSPEMKRSFLQDTQADNGDGRKLKLELEAVIDGDNLSSGTKSMKEISGE